MKANQLLSNQTKGAMMKALSIKFSDIEKMDAVLRAQALARTEAMLEKLQYSRNEFVAKLAEKLLYGETTLDEELSFAGGFITAVIMGDEGGARRLADGFNLDALNIPTMRKVFAVYRSEGNNNYHIWQSWTREEANSIVDFLSKKEYAGKDVKFEIIPEQTTLLPKEYRIQL